jgi:putative hemolysin
VLKLLGLAGRTASAVTEEEIAAQLEEGLDAGVIEAQEHQMVRNVFRLDDRQIGSMMIPRAELVWLDVNAPVEHLLAEMVEHGHSRYPVCRGGLDDVIGVVGASDLLGPLSRGEMPSLLEHLSPPVFVPETLTGMELVEHFRRNDVDLVFVVDEYGAVQGLISERDLLEAIAGELGEASAEDAWATQRTDGSWLMDGLIPAHELKDRLSLKDLPDEDRGRYNTLAGMIMLLLGRLPATADAVEWSGWRFEVVDLDGKRVDKVLVSRLPDSPHPETS